MLRYLFLEMFGLGLTVPLLPFQKTGGEMKEKCDITIVVPWNKYSDRIQEIHIKIIHILIEYIEQALFNTNK